MMYRWGWALVAMCMGASSLACAATPAPAAAMNPAVATARALPVKTVTQPDGSVVERLILSAPGRFTPAPLGGPDAAPPAWAGRDPQRWAEWLDAMAEPRFMTALATVALEPQADAQTLAGQFDPARVRNWSEFIDPNLFMRWMAAGMDPRFSLALFNRFADPRQYLRWAAYPAAAMAQLANPAMPSTWMGAMAHGMAPVLTGAPATQEWLKLPSSDPKANPWLAHSATYRY